MKLRKAAGPSEFSIKMTIASINIGVDHVMLTLRQKVFNGKLQVFHLNMSLL